MQVLLKSDVIVLSAENENDRLALAELAKARAEHVFHLKIHGEKGCGLHDLGPHEDACREPINVVFEMGEKRFEPISNLAHAPFVLHGRRYASVEGFWQSLKFDGASERARVADLFGHEAKRAAAGVPEQDTFTYEGATVRVGRPEHWALMRQACAAKFTQDETARTALLATHRRPLVHQVRRDSQTIPGVIMADIWMRIRALLRDGRLKPATA